MDTISEISLEALATVNGGWAREGLRDTGAAVGGMIDEAGLAAYHGAQWAGQQVAAGARAVGQAAVATSNAVRTGVANGFDTIGNGFNSAADFVRPHR